MTTRWYVTVLFGRETKVNINNNKTIILKPKETKECRGKIKRTSTQ